MTVSRRTTLKGIGAVMAGGGAEILRSAAASGETDRDVQIEFVTDADASIGIAPGQDSPYISYDMDSDGRISISLTDLNLNAGTRFEELLEFTNNTNQAIAALEIDVNSESHLGTIEAEPVGGTPSLDPGETILDLALTIDTREAELSSEDQLSAKVQITADVGDDQ